MSDVLIKARNIKPQLTDTPSSLAADIDILADNIYGFIGPDSSQISAWLQTLAAIEPPASGEVLFMDKKTTNIDRSSWQALRNSIAYLNSRSALVSVLSTQENILLPALYHQLATRETLLDQMSILLIEIGFADMENLTKLPAYLDEVSYSQAMLVRVALTKPRVVVIDNTLRHFDERNSRKLLSFIKNYIANTQASLLLQDDDANFVIKNATKFVFIDENSLLQFNTRNDLQSSDNISVQHYLHELTAH